MQAYSASVVSCLGSVLITRRSGAGTGRCGISFMNFNRAVLVAEQHARAAAIHAPGCGRVLIAIVDFELVEVRLYLPVASLCVELETGFLRHENSDRKSTRLNSSH